MKKNLLIIKNSWPFFFGLIIGLYFITFNIVGNNLSHFPGDLGDGRFNNYILEHGHKYISGQEKSFWNAPFMFPEENIISYSDNLIGTVPFYSIFRILGLDRETAYQCWFVLMFALSYLTCYLFLKWCFKNNYAAVLGSMIFAFSMAMQSQMTHAQMFPRFPIPIAFWMCLLFIKELKPIYFIGAIFTVVYQFYCGIYLGFFLSAVIGILLLIILINNYSLLLEKVKNIRWITQISIGLIINIVIILPLMIPYIKRSKAVGFNVYENIVSTIPTLRSYFFSQDGSLFWKMFQETGTKYPAYWDHQIYAGGVATFCLMFFIGFILFKIITKQNCKDFNKSLLIILFSSGLATFLLFTRYQGFSFYKMIFILPSFASLRCVTRIITVELIYFSIATAFVFTLINNKLKNYSGLLFLLFSTLIIADNYYKVDKSYRTQKTESQIRIKNLIVQMKGMDEGSIISYEPLKLVDNPVHYQLDGMLASQSENMKSVNGYSATCPSGFGDFWNNPSIEARKEWFKSKNFNPDTVYVLR